ncbi:unnamed protein product, partial [Meganyctiphanes norvegica]
QLPILLFVLLALASAEPHFKKSRRPSYRPATHRTYHTASQPSYRPQPVTYRKAQVHHSPPSYHKAQPQTYGHHSPPSYHKAQPHTYGHHSPPSYHKAQPQTYGHQSPVSYHKTQPQKGYVKGH